METNGNGWFKPISIGVAVIVVAAAILGSAGNTFSNSIHAATQDVNIAVIKEDIKEQQELTKGIDVMAEQINDIKENVQTILRKLDK